MSDDTDVMSRNGFETELRDALMAAAVRMARHADLVEQFEYCCQNTDETHIAHLHFHCTDVDDLDTWAIASTWPDPLWRYP